MDIEQPSNRQPPDGTADTSALPHPPRRDDDVGRGLAGFRRYTWWSLSSGAVVLLLVPTMQWLSTGPFALWLDVLRWSGVAVTALTCIRITTALLPRDGTSPTRATLKDVPPGWLGIGVLGAGTASIVTLVQGDVLFWSLPVAMLVTFVAALLPLRLRTGLLVGAGVAAAVVAWVWTANDGDGLYLPAVWFALGLVAFLAFLNLAQVWTWNVAARLDDARRVAGELAVADERLRFAAELHDIQGHSLQVIALQSELAARLVERDPARAATQMRAVQTLANEALRDTRELVRGYRHTSLTAEIANATGVLAAAAIDGRMQVAPDVDVDALEPAHRQVLGLAVREATTNVLRHSDARRATVELATVDGHVELRVSNDGAPDDSDHRGTDGTLAAPSDDLGGLSDLARRVRSLGGELLVAQRAGTFEVVARVPATGKDAPPRPAGAVQEGRR